MSAQHELDNPPSDAISSVSFSSSGTKLAVGSWDRTVSIYQRAESGETPFIRQTGVQCRAPVLDVCWGADEETLYCVGLDQDVRCLKGEGDEQEVLSTHEAASNKVAYSREHGIVISTSWDGIMHIHDPTTQRYIRVRLPAKPFALSLTADRAVVAMAERKVSVYDLRAFKALVEQAGGTGSMLDVLEVAPWQQRESSLKFMTRAISCMPDGSGFATSSIEGRVGVEWFDPEQQKRTYAFKCHRQTSTMPAEEGEEEGEREVDIVYPVNALAFHPVHGTFATGGGDGVVAMWDAQTKRRVRQYPKLASSVAAMEFSGDGKYLAIAVSPGFEDGQEDEEMDASLVKVVVRELSESEAKGKPAK
ncbi:hypothetical protein LTR36_003779 [Oleoguttula mirabilis]|uniref:Mitotic checkpoint protein BUB3 n=1 Tax=Oleoguttula mirabilis TaxID=1507867 RepID=A0AAV9JI15_9PEZI|nr:hypothetical protein LTR36_003779 [Oleoguttula mirabilis]